MNTRFVLERHKLPLSRMSQGQSVCRTRYVGHHALPSILSQSRCVHVPRPRLNFKYIKENAVEIKKNCKHRKLPLADSHVDEVVEKYTVYTQAVNDLNTVLARRNALSRAIKASSQEDKSSLLKEAATLKPRIQELELRKADAENSMIKLGSVLPNDTHHSTPIGDESKVRIIKYVNEENQYTSDEALDHVEIARRLDLVDFDSAAKASGTGFYYLKNEAVLLEIALTQFALNEAKKAGFGMMRCPDLVRSEFVSACGFQPRDSNGQQIYEVSKGELSLVGTAEIPLAALGVDKVFNENDMPARYVAVGRAFRAEAGARGAETRGLYRVHEFTKIELFSFCAPKNSDTELARILDLQTSIIKQLGICARLLEMPTEELGASAHQKFDFEAWIPSRNNWGEITSASNCTDYQARRLNTRYRCLNSKTQESESAVTPHEFIHTLNGTAIAIPRLLVAGLETWTSHGRIKLPSCLHSYMGGMSEIGVRAPQASSPPIK